MSDAYVSNHHQRALAHKGIRRGGLAIRINRVGSLAAGRSDGASRKLAAAADRDRNNCVSFDFIPEEV